MTFGLDYLSVVELKKLLSGKKVSVVGLGVSNVPAIDFLNRCGAVVTGCDRRTKDEMSDELFARLNRECDELHLGEDYLDYLDGEDMILKSPGILPIPKQISDARANGTVLTSEMELFMMSCPCKIIGVTGSDGKTTTTTLISKFLAESNYVCHVGGNIGNPLLAQIEQINDTDIVVLELSSFQLMNMRVSPDIAVVTNVSPNHLDHHRDMTEYVEAKANIFTHQGKDGKLIVNRENTITASFIGRQNGRVLTFSSIDTRADACVKDGYLCLGDKKYVRAEDIFIKGRHNVENYLAAIAATEGLVGPSVVEKVAKTFHGVEHRMEFVREKEGIEFYNDSIGSSPTRTIAGLTAHEGKIVLIAGGYDKNLNYNELAAVIRDRVSALVLVGDTAKKIKTAVNRVYGKTPDIPIVVCNNFDDVVPSAYVLARALADARTGSSEKISVILSPASASFDMFKNFEERGKKFKQLVNDLDNESFGE